MSDAFGGILDDMRGVVTDASSFFGHSLSTAALRAIQAGSTGGQEQGYKNYQKLKEANELSKMNNVPDNHSPYQEGYAPARDPDRSTEARPSDYDTIEQQWLARLHRFGQIDAEIQTGKVNEGKPQ